MTDPRTSVAAFAAFVGRPVDDDKITHSGAKARLERGYEQQPDGMTVRRQRRNDLGGADE